MAGNPLRVVIFTSVPPRQVARILARIRRDASEAPVVGVLDERRPPKTLLQRIEIWRKKMKRLDPRSNWFSILSGSLLPSTCLGPFPTGGLIDGTPRISIA